MEILFRTWVARAVTLWAVRDFGDLATSPAASLRFSQQGCGFQRRKRISEASSSQHSVRDLRPKSLFRFFLTLLDCHFVSYQIRPCDGHLEDMVSKILRTVPYSTEGPWFSRAGGATQFGEPERPFRLPCVIPRQKTSCLANG